MKASPQASVRLFLKPSTFERVLFLDGFTRAGKKLSAKLSCILKNIEYFQLSEPVDYLPIIWKLGHLDDQSAAAYLRLQLDMVITNRVIGRNLNQRVDDASSIHLAPDKHRYFARMHEPDMDKLMLEFSDSRRLPLLFTHDLLPHISLLFAAVPNPTILEVVRHPIDLAASWFRRGWGERWGRDPGALTPVADYHGEPLPWFAVNWADDYLQMRPVDRVLRSIIELNNLCDESVQNLNDDQRSQIHFFAYEHLLEAPETTFNKIADVLGTELIGNLPEVFAREGVPRDNPISDLEAKLGMLRDQEKADDQLLVDALELGREYEDRWQRPRLAG